MQTKAAVRKARQTQQDGLDFLSQSALRRKEEAAAKGAEHRAHRGRRIKALLGFKESLEASKGAIAARQLLRDEDERRRREGEEEERRGILAQGGNPREVALRNKRMREFAERKETLEHTKQERQLEIVAKLLLEEEEELGRRRRGQVGGAARQPSQHSLVGRWQAHRKRREGRSKGGGRSDNKSGDGGGGGGDGGGDGEGGYGGGGGGSAFEGGVPDKGEVPGGQAGLKETTSSESEDGDAVLLMEGGVGSGDEDLAEPEIRGLWDTTAARRKKPAGAKMEVGGGDAGVVAVRPAVLGTKAEQEMMSRTMEGLRRGMVTKQVAGGREFKVQPS